MICRARRTEALLVSGNFRLQGRRNIFQHCYDRSCVNLTIFCFYSASCPVSATDGAAIGFRTKVINFCLFTFNDDIIRRQIRFLMYEIFIFFIIMLYCIFFLWNSCSTLLIYSNMLVEKGFLLSTIFSLSNQTCPVCWNLVIYCTYIYYVWANN